ncbi:MAG: tRNA lysidine(34) synthetase TilS, partial [Parvularculaceae bacterium]
MSADEPNSSAAPLAVEEFISALDALEAPGRILVAVSGGPDSMALLRLTAAHGRREVAAATIDHGLRPESAEEAAQVARWAAAIGVAHVTLPWPGAKPATGVQEQARLARYRLLCEYASSADFGAVLIAHHADDQAETLFMRLARGSGLNGLAAMNASLEIAAGAGPPVRFLRPLLGFPRRRLHASLEAFGQTFLRDPSNENPDFERVRVRGLLAALSAQELLTGEALARSAVRLSRAAARLDREERQSFALAGGAFHQSGWVRLSEPGRVDASLLRRLVHAVGGGDFPAPEEDAGRALAAARNTGAATLG